MTTSEPPWPRWPRIRSQLEAELQLKRNLPPLRARLTSAVSEAQVLDVGLGATLEGLGAVPLPDLALALAVASSQAAGARTRADELLTEVARQLQEMEQRSTFVYAGTGSALNTAIAESRTLAEAARRALRDLRGAAYDCTEAVQEREQAYGHHLSRATTDAALTSEPV